ncbi:MAG: hypothetical protein ABIM50_12995 [Novosphingobium sp.]
MITAPNIGPTIGRTIAPPRRYLVLTDEGARHPFRASLPPHVREPISDAVQPVRGWRQGWRLSRQDWRQFLTTWCAGFVVVSVFIS